MTNQPPSTEELTEWERLAEGATEGPWYSLGRTVHPDVPGLKQLATLLRCVSKKKEAEGNAAFIAAARTGWPRTIVALKGACSEIERLESNEARDAERISDFEKNWGSPEMLHAKDREIEELLLLLDNLTSAIKTKLTRGEQEYIDAPLRDVLKVLDGATKGVRGWTRNG